jgi:hypothetical protein
MRAAGSPQQPTKYERTTVMGKLEAKVAVITAATSGMALATASSWLKRARTSSSPEVANLRVHRVFDNVQHLIK